MNAALHKLSPDTNETHWRVLNPRGQHSIAAGIDAPICVEIEGHVGYYCAGMNKQARVVVHGNAGQGVAENMMSGHVHVHGDASQAAGASGCGGLLVIDGNASARCGISMKGIDIVVKGSVGHLSAFMAQTGNLVVLGDAGEALGDSIYESQPLCPRQGQSLGADCMEKPLTTDHKAELRKLLDAAGVNDELDVDEFSRYGSARKLYHFHIDNVGSLLMSAPGPLDPHAAAKIGDVRRLCDRRNPPGRRNRHLRHPRRRHEAQAAAFRRPPVSGRFDQPLSAGRLSRAMRDRCHASGRASPRSRSSLKIPITIAGMSFGALVGTGQGSARARRLRWPAPRPRPATAE